MDFPDGTISGQSLKGGAQMRRMALTALTALERADLGDAAQLLWERVFSRKADVLLERYQHNQVWRWRFKPMAELLLLELTHLAEAGDLSPEERRQRIEWAITMAGF